MKRVLAVVMLLCLIFTVGCGSEDPAVKKAEKPIEVKDETLKSVVASYAAKGAEGFGDFNYDSFSNVSVIGDKAYLLGNSMYDEYIYSIELDGSSPVIIAHEDTEDESWVSLAALGDKLYVCDKNTGNLIEFDSSGSRLRTVTLPEGTLTIPTLVGGDKYLYAFDMGGGRLTAIDPEGDERIAFTINVTPTASLGKLADGRAVIGTYEDNGTRISVIDEENKCLGESRYIDINCTIQGCGSEWSVYLESGADIYGFDFDSAKLEKLFSLNDVGIRMHGRLYDCGNGSFIYTASLGDYMDKPTLIYKTEVPTDAKRLTLATLRGLDYGMQKKVLRWNAAHPECRIDIKDYSVYNTESDLSLGQAKLALDITAGETPDMYDLSVGDSTINTPLLARRGLLEDLYSYIDADPELDRSDFMSEPLKAMEINGKLYQATSSFMLFTMMGAAADVGGPDEWTYAALEQKIAESEQYQRLTDERSEPSDWLRVTVEASGARLVDWEKGVCHFDSDYFIHLLELSAGMERPDTESATPRGILRDTGALLFTLTSRSVGEGAMGAQTFGDGNYAFVGYPEVGAVIYPTESVGISAQSGSKEDCWQFVRQFMMKGARSGFPLRYDEIEEDYELACKDVHTTEGEKQAMRDFIAHAESASVCCRPDEQLWAIIESELNRFYAGQNTAAQTAQAIQSRASIYLSEQN